jgi:hypothetical protein
MCIAVLTAPVVVPAQHHHSPYAGEEKRAVKTLSDEERRALLQGEGMGLAKAAELNHYPGPRHVLDLAEPLQLSAAQRAEAQAIYERMHREAVRLGALIVDRERDLDQLFATRAASAQTLYQLAGELAQLRGVLRVTHLQAHVEMRGVLSDEQVAAYDQLRGYHTSAASQPQTGSQHHHHQ